jgi:murein DD-endopeptidase MepM/ murein hydrolase activator NlpD
VPAPATAVLALAAAAVTGLAVLAPSSAQAPTVTPGVTEVRPAAAAPRVAAARGAPSAAAPEVVVAEPGLVAPRPGTGWTWPLSPAPAVVRRFDVGPFPWSPGHRGVDLVPSGDATVRAAGPGVVRFAGVVAGRGVVSVDHGSGLRTTYEPVDATVARGARVAAGQPLGTLSGAGHCAGTPCLHWGALLDDRYVDPLGLLRPREPPVLLPVGP